MTGGVRRLGLVLALVVSACAPAPAPTNLAYDGRHVPWSLQPARAKIDIWSVTDKRPPINLGVRTASGADIYGVLIAGPDEQINVLRTPVPVADVFRQGFTDGLKARELFGSEGRHGLELDIERFEASLNYQREAHAVVTLRLIDKISREVVYQRRVVADQVWGPKFNLTVMMALSDEVRKVANAVLQEVIDKSLGDPDLMQAVTRLR